MASKSLSRRSFLRSAVGAGVTVTVGGVALGADHIAAALPHRSSTAPAKYALIIDTTKCVGCGACRKACQHRNDLPDEVSYIHILTQGDEANPTFIPVQCQHCASPPCARVCPANATYRLDSGVVMIKEKKCVGCKYCELACPYQARVFDEERGVADKCWLCLDRVTEGQDPACVAACVFGARIFGLQDDANSEVAQLIASGAAKPFHPEFGTEPSILYYIM
jgi:Fe-S-cluster-containing dehydrogenase component